MALPTRGSCVTADGSIADSHWHEMRPGVSNRTMAARKQAAEAICQSCPVLEMCRTYAALSSWQNVTVAAWTAPSHTEAFPPWTPDWCVACGREQSTNPNMRFGLLCNRCYHRRWHARQDRWWSYVGDGTIPA